FFVLCGESAFHFLVGTRVVLPHGRAVRALTPLALVFATLSAQARIERAGSARFALHPLTASQWRNTAANWQPYRTRSTVVIVFMLPCRRKKKLTRSTPRDQLGLHPIICLSACNVAACQSL